jgi:hypothetical protein
MKNLLAAVVAALLLLPFAGGVSAKEKAPDAKAQHSVKRGKLITTTATVVSVDQKQRIVTLKDPKGIISDIKVGDEVRNLAQLKAGDLVTVKYYQSLLIELMKPGKGAGDMQTKTTMERAKPGEKPHGMIGGQVTVTAKITAINKKDQTVTLKGSGGKSVVAKAENPHNLDLVKVGDELKITYSEAVAISVEGAKK